MGYGFQGQGQVAQIWTGADIAYVSLIEIGMGGPLIEPDL